jgi:hypothetical protein
MDGPCAIVADNEFLARMDSARAASTTNSTGGVMTRPTRVYCPQLVRMPLVPRTCSQGSVARLSMGLDFRPGRSR